MRRTPEEVELRLERPNRTREYIPPKMKQNSKTRLNLNPFSTRGGLDRLSFLATLAILMVVLYLANYLVRGPLQLARASLDVTTAAQFYAVKIGVGLLGFWMISAAYIRRWNAILRKPVKGFRRNLIRFFLLSPLLSIWFTFFTLINGPLLRGARFIAGLATLILFHLGFIGWLIYDGALTAGPGLTVHLARETSHAQSLNLLLPIASPRPWVPTETFMIHAEPYLSPVWKMGISTLSDFQRMKALDEEVSDPSSPLCQEVLGYIGQPVNDCFFYNFRKLGELRPFTTPALATIFEQGHSKELPLPAGTDPATVSPMRKIAPALLSVKNLVTMMEFGPGRSSYRKFLHPIGLLQLFSSPEIAMLEAGQDAQRFAFSRKIIPLVKPQVVMLQSSTDSILSVITPGEADDLKVELADIKGRLEALERDPLGVRQSFDADGDVAEEPTGTNAGAPSKE